MHFCSISAAQDCLVEMTKELACVFHSHSTSNDMDHSIMGDGKREVFVEKRFELELLSTLHCVVHVVQSNDNKESFCNASL